MTCQTCSAEFEPKILSVLGVEVFRQLHCPACIAEQERHLNAHWAAEHSKPVDHRETAWAAICPLEYRTTAEGGLTDAKRLAAECLRLREVVEWPGDGKGMLLEGETGKCKTRAAWRLLRRIHDNGGIVRALSSGGFGRGFADATGKHLRMEWFNDLAFSDILLIDDVGKSRWTAAVWGEFFEIIDSRGINGKPTVLTTNETTDSLGSKARALDPELWDPLLRRLREFKRIAL
jgi:DNA replication protein DnaC